MLFDHHFLDKSVTKRSQLSTNVTIFHCTITAVLLLSCVGSNSELRSIAEYYASNDANERCVRDFIKAWDRVISSDRSDLKN
jgi:catalase (peroxidase I)